MRKISFLLLRIGLAVTFLWIGILIFQSPEAWGGFLQPWAQALLFMPIRQVMLATAVLDIAVGVVLLSGRLVWLAALVGSLHLLVVLITSGITDVTARDIGLFAAMVALTIESMPSAMRNKFSRM